MKLIIASLALILMSFMTGCESTGSSHVSYSMYSGYHYPSYGYGGGYYYYRPPDYNYPDRPDRPRPEHPIERPDRPIDRPITRPDRPTTRPSRSSMGRPSSMGRSSMGRSSGRRR